MALVRFPHAGTDHPRSRGVYAQTLWGGFISGGSSPLARGLLGELLGDGGGPGIIPARAGFTRGRGNHRSHDRDHPRSRGVYALFCLEYDMSPGSSPLARGLPAVSGSVAPRPGIIPARAGFTTILIAPHPLSTDHPRSRGVYYHEIAHETADQGSSPLARGLRMSFGVFSGGRRIIPARAGFTDHIPCIQVRSGDHPRSRGVYGARASFRAGCVGSSPLARGLPTSVTYPTPTGGIIPARAGFTPIR